MQSIFLKSKIHRATVTACDLHYEGSIEIDQDILDAANIKQYEKVDIWNINNGNRFSTYAMNGKRGSREFMINGAAARMAQKGDLIIIATFALFTEEEFKTHTPKILLLEENNYFKVK